MPSAPQPFVLVVDDDEDIRSGICDLLQDEGFAVRAAADGADALRKLRHEPHAAVILLDLMMPVMNGWQFMDEQRRDPLLAAIPIILITADASAPQKEAQARASGYGAAGYLRKPFAAESLVEMIQLYL